MTEGQAVGGGAVEEEERLHAFHYYRSCLLSVSRSGASYDERIPCTPTCGSWELNNNNKGGHQNAWWKMFHHEACEWTQGVVEEKDLGTTDCV